MGFGAIDDCSRPRLYASLFLIAFAVRVAFMLATHSYRHPEFGGKAIMGFFGLRALSPTGAHASQYFAILWVIYPLPALSMQSGRMRYRSNGPPFC